MVNGHTDSLFSNNLASPSSCSFKVADLSKRCISDERLNLALQVSRAQRTIMIDISNNRKPARHVRIKPLCIIIEEPVGGHRDRPQARTKEKEH